MSVREAQCSCGKLTARCEGEPVRVSICHCLACQRRTGSPFGEQARWPADKVTLLGGSKCYERTGDSGTKIRFHFCPDCGSTVHYDLEALPGFVVIPVGAFADPSFPPPTRSVYEDRKHAWIVVPDGAEHFA